MQINVLVTLFFTFYSFYVNIYKHILNKNPWLKQQSSHGNLIYHLQNGSFVIAKHVFKCKCYLYWINLWVFDINSQEYNFTVF